MRNVLQQKSVFVVRVGDQLIDLTANQARAICDASVSELCAIRKLLIESMIESPNRKTLTDIERVVCEEFKIPPADLHKKCREQRVVIPRQIVWSYGRLLCQISWCELGRFYGLDHKTPQKGLESLEAKRSAPEIKSIIERIDEKVGSIAYEHRNGHQRNGKSNPPSKHQVVARPAHQGAD